MRRFSPAVMPAVLALLLFVSSAFAMMDHAASSGKYSDRAFLSGMIAHHEGAVAMAQQFLDTPRQTRDPQVSAWAREILTTQKKEVDEMRALLPTVGGMDEAAFKDMQMSMEGMLHIGMNKNPNVGFVEMMLPHHEQALEMAAPALLYSRNPRVLDLAEAIIIAQAKEMRALQAWLARHVSH